MAAIASASPAIIVPETLDPINLLGVLRRARGSFVIVTNEFGVVQGLVTPLDVLEAIAGEFPDADETPEIITDGDGTERDPQCRSQQIATLEDAGIAVVSSLPEATLLAAALIHPLSPATQQHTPSLLENVALINIGLRSFALELQSASKPVVHYQWSPVAGGNKKLARLLERLQ